MSPDPSSHASSNVIMALAAGAAAFLILRTPALRQTAWRALQRTVTITLPGYLAYHVKEAWTASGQRT